MGGQIPPPDAQDCLIRLINLSIKRLYQLLSKYNKFDLFMFQ